MLIILVIIFTINIAEVRERTYISVFGAQEGTCCDCCNVSFFYRKGKVDAPKTPTTPTSPVSPSFSSAGGPLSPHLATGDSIRDKCIEMLAAALRTDG